MHLCTFLCREHSAIFAQNGFEFKEGPDGSLLLSGVPYSKNMTFDKADVQELAQLLHEGSTPVPISKQAQNDAIQRVPVNVSDKLVRPSR